MNSKKNLYLSLVLLFIVVTGSFLLIKRKPVIVPAPSPTVEIEELPPVDESVQVNLTPSVDGKSVKLEVNNIPENTLSIEYELSYLTDKGLPKGALGKIDLNNKNSIVRDILLGTCSKNTCTFDKGVKTINLVLKFNNPTGASQYTNEYPLE